MQDSWHQVVVEADPSTMQPPDIAGLGPAPRELTPRLARYVKVARPSLAALWIVLAVLALGGFAIGVAVLGVTARALSQAWLPALLVFVAVRSIRKTSRGRAALRAVLRDGGLRFARLRDLQTITLGRGLARRYRYTARFAIDDCSITITSMDPSMGMLPDGMLVEVVYDPAHPGEIVPTILLA